MSFQFLYTYGGEDRDITGYWRNVVGNPVMSAVKYGGGYDMDATPMAGVYRFRFETSSTVSCRRVSVQDTLNPLIYEGSREVIADYSTENANILPGWNLVFRGDAQIGDEFEIGVGCILDETSKTWQRVLSFGPRVPGFMGAERSIIVKNVSGGTLTDCRLYATNAIRIVNDQAPNRPFMYFWQRGILNPEPDGDLTGAAVTLDNYAAGSPPTVDLLMDGNPVDVMDDETGVIVPGGVGLESGYWGKIYRFADGSKYQSGTFMLGETIEETDTATMHVSGGGSSVWLAPDGGTFVPGPSGIVLTQSGQADGTILVDGTVTVNVRVVPAAGCDPDLNMFSFSLRAVGMDETDTMVSTEHQGSFFVARGDAPLSFRINAVKEAYPRPRYSEDPENPGHFVPDVSGEYVEDLTAPGTFILASLAPNQGNYRNIWDYLAENGVVIESV